MNTTGRSVTKTVRIACDPQAAFDFLADLGNWPLRAVVNVKATSRTDDPDGWDMVTPRGTARIRMRACAVRAQMPLPPRTRAWRHRQTRKK